jgi:hypothetical protein
VIHANRNPGQLQLLHEKPAAAERQSPWHKMKFTDHSQNQRAIVTAIDRFPSADPREAERIKIIHGLLEEFFASPDQFDQLTSFTRAQIGRFFTEIVASIRTLDHDKIGNLFMFLVRCAREIDIRSKRAVGGPIKSALDYYFAPNAELTADEIFEKEVLREHMPRWLLFDISEALTSKGAEIESRVQRMTKEAASLEKRLDDSAALVKRYQAQFNFVGLAQAFREFGRSKKLEKWLCFSLLSFFAILIVIPPVAQLSSNTQDGLLTVSDGTVASIKFGKLVPLLVVEVFLLYFFRVVLKSYYSVKAQLLQIELRYSLCAFIESYADFAKERGKTADGQLTLSKFESLIFSGIVPDSSKVPSTFDGIEQIGRVIAEVKKSAGP